MEGLGRCKSWKNIFDSKDIAGTNKAMHFRVFCFLKSKVLALGYSNRGTVND